MIINPARVAMFTVKPQGLAVEMDGVWGETIFHYATQQDMMNDCTALYAALQELTRSRLMQFLSEGAPVVPIYRMTRIYLNEWWKRIEVDVDQAGRKWFEYPTTEALYAEYNKLASLMNQI